MTTDHAAEKAAMVPSSAVSGFSFLTNAASGGSSTGGDDEAATAVKKEEIQETRVAQEGAYHPPVDYLPAASESNISAFSFLSSGGGIRNRSVLTPLSSERATTPHYEIKAATKKTIKKTRRGKQVGVRAHSASNSSSEIPPPPSAFSSRNLSHSSSSVAEEPSKPQVSIVEESSKPPIKVGAEEAIRKAENFMMEKRISTNHHSYREDEEDRTSKSPTVAQGQAAEEESRTMSNTDNKKAFAGGMASFLSKTRTKIGLFKEESDKSYPNPHRTSESVNPSTSLHELNKDHPTTSTDLTSSFKKTLPKIPQLETEELSDHETPSSDDKEEAIRTAVQEEQRLAQIKRLNEQAEAIEKQKEEDRLRQIQAEEERLCNMTPVQEFMRLIDEFALRAQTSLENISHLRSRRWKLMQEKDTALQRALLASQLISQTECQQTCAAEVEDFDLADRLVAVIETRSKDKINQEKLLRSICKDMDEIDSRRQTAVQELAQCFDDVKQQLQEFYHAQDRNEKRDSTETLERFAATFKQLSAEQDRLNAELKHIERDEAMVAEERKQMEDLIGEETCDIDIQRKETSEKLSSVEEEIISLKRQLQEKETRAAELTEQLSIHDTEIEKIRSKFSRHITRVSKKEISVQESRHEYKIEKDALRQMREKHEAEVQSHSESLLEHETMMKNVKLQMEEADKMKTITEEEIEVGNYNAEVASHADEELEQLQSDLVKCKAAVNEAETILTAAEAALATLKKEVEEIDRKIPELEAQKKTAAAKRDFKAASKASKLLKGAVARKERCEEEISGEALDKLNAAKEEHDKLLAEFATKQDFAHDKERDQAVERMIKLGNKIWRLEKIKNDLCKDTTDVQNSVSTVGAAVLDNQITALKSEGEQLGDKFGGWKEILRAGLDIPAEDDLNKENFDTDELKNEGVREDEALSSLEESPENVTVVQTEDEVPTQQEQDTPGEVRRKRIQQWNEWKKLMDDIEASIEKAVENEDYDRAAELDEELSSIRNKIEVLGITDKEKKEDRDEKILRWTQLQNQLNEAEKSLEEAVASEDSDKASELDVLISNIKGIMDTLDLSDEDKGKE